MTGGRPRTAIGTYGAVYVRRNVDRCVAETRVRDLDGRLRKVTATAGRRLLPGPKPDGQVRDIIEVLLGTAMRPGEVLALRPCDIEDGRSGMIASVTGTVVHCRGHGAVRQDRPKTDSSVRRIPVPAFAAAVLRRRLVTLKGVDQGEPSSPTAPGGPLSPYNVRRTFREFLDMAGLGD